MNKRPFSIENMSWESFPIFSRFDPKFCVNIAEPDYAFRNAEIAAIVYFAGCYVAVVVTCFLDGLVREQRQYGRRRGGGGWQPVVDRPNARCWWHRAWRQ